MNFNNYIVSILLDLYLLFLIILNTSRLSQYNIVMKITKLCISFKLTYYFDYLLQYVVNF